VKGCDAAGDPEALDGLKRMRGRWNAAMGLDAVKS
jgi:hypothetical protein